jgi:hypothetical protein
VSGKVKGQGKLDVNIVTDWALGSGGYNGLIPIVKARLYESEIALSADRWQHNICVAA